MAASIPVKTATIILGVIAGVYSIITVVLLVCICCICYKKRKVRSVVPEYISPLSSDAELDPGSNPESSKSTTDDRSVANKAEQLPSRYRSRSKKKPGQTTTCSKWEGSRDSPVLHQRDAWNGENSNPRTPDSGLASSVADSKYSEGGATAWARTGGLNDSSSKSSHSTGSNEDVYDETLAQPQNTTSKNIEDTKREIRRRPKAVRTESTTPLMEVDCRDPRTHSSEMELDLKAIMSPIREKTRSHDSLDGTIFVNKSAIAAAESENDKTITYTELATIKDSSVEVLHTAAAGRGRHQLPPIQQSSGAVNLDGGRLPSMAGRLPPLFPPGHSQEDLDKSEQLTTRL